MSEPLTSKDLVVGGFYNWKGQPERLSYIGAQRYNGDSRTWHQFALVDVPGVCWCEVLDWQLNLFEVTERAAVQAAQPEAVGWVKAVQSFADELELPFLEAKSFLDEVFPQWMADKEAAGFITLRLDELIEGDSYGVDGSDFYRCRICHSESGAGMLNNGIKHEHDCPLASAPTPEPMSAPTEAKPATQQASGGREALTEPGRDLIAGVLRCAAWTHDAVGAPALAKQAREALETFKRAALSMPAQQDAVDAEQIKKALNQAFVMGQNYWHDADSESYAANKRSDVTRQKFKEMRDELCAAISAKKVQP